MVLPGRLQEELGKVHYCIFRSDKSWVRVNLVLVKIVTPSRVWGSARELYEKMPADLTYRVDKIFIHPLLGSNEVFP